MMIVKDVHGYFVQDTWLLGPFSTTIQGHLLFHHGMAKKRNQQGIISSDVAFIMDPALIRACYMAFKPPAITSAINSDLPGHIIGVTL